MFSFLETLLPSSSLEGTLGREVAMWLLVARQGPLSGPCGLVAGLTLPLEWWSLRSTCSVWLFGASLRHHCRVHCPGRFPLVAKVKLSAASLSFPWGPTALSALSEPPCFFNCIKETSGILSAVWSGYFLISKVQLCSKSKIQYDLLERTQKWVPELCSNPFVASY